MIGLKVYEMNPVTFSVIGLGSRGLGAYAPYATAHPDQMRIVAVADLVPARRQKAASQFGLAPGAVFGSAEELLARPRLSDAIIIGFQVRPSANARKLAEKEEIEIRLYSVIYDAINEVKSGIEGMLAPEEKEEVTATAEVAETFKISKVGTIAGCVVKEGKLTRTSKVRVIRDGIVVYTGELGSLKRFKDDVKEVTAGMDCGLNIAGYNDIKVGDVVEAYNIVEIKRTL